MDNMGTDLAAHFTAGTAVVYVIEWMKKSPRFGWCSEDGKKINRILSAGVAAAIAFGISLSGDPVSGWTIQIPPLAALISGVWEWMQQFFAQQFIYDVAVARPKAPKPPPPSGPPPPTILTGGSQ